MQSIPKTMNGRGLLDAAALKRVANRLRFSAMTMTNHAGLGHTGGDLSSADILTTHFGIDIAELPRQCSSHHGEACSREAEVDARCH